MRKEREWKVRGLFWLFGIKESKVESWRKERSIFINWHKYPWIKIVHITNIFKMNIHINMYTFSMKAKFG